MDAELRFVTDTHALWWYLKSPERLTAVVRLSETGNTTIVVPAIDQADF